MHPFSDGRLVHLSMEMQSKIVQTNLIELAKKNSDLYGEIEREIEGKCETRESGSL